MRFWTDTSLAKYSSTTEAPEENTGFLSMQMAKNEYVSAQILLRSDKPFQIRGISFSYIEGLSFRYNFQDFIRFDEGGSYPDPLSNHRTCTVDANFTQSIWITAYAAESSDVGQYSCTVTVDTDDGIYPFTCNCTVYPINIPKTSRAAFSMEYWINTVAFWWRYPNSNDLIAQHYGCEKYSDRWWKIMQAIAKNMRENRINVLFTRTQDLLLDGGTTLDGDHYQFSWDLFDRFIEFFIQHADVKEFVGFQLIRQTEGEVVHTLGYDETGKMAIVDQEIGSAAAENWLNQFLPALKAHLIEKGWYSRWRQHIQDEPAFSSAWIYGRSFVRKHMPEIRCGDAIDNQSPMPELQGEMNLWIPRIDIYEQNRAFYDYRSMVGDERWTYTCCLPNTPNYLNKFIDWPLWQNRLLGWGCFSRRFTGFLHWGYDHWDTTDEWFGLHPKAHLKGDGYLVYPDPETDGIKNSIRAINTRDAAQDYELLNLLAQKNPQRAFDMANILVRSFHDFEWDSTRLLTFKKELLESLSA